MALIVVMPDRISMMKLVRRLSESARLSTASCRILPMIIAARAKMTSTPAATQASGPPMTQMMAVNSRAKGRSITTIAPWLA